jgi:hypothetical protein
MDSLKVLDPEWPIREAEVAASVAGVPDPQSISVTIYKLLVAPHFEVS